MNKEERKRLINANYGLNYNKKLENSHIDQKTFRKINLPENAIYTATDSIIVNNFDIETEMRQPWKNITH